MTDPELRDMLLEKFAGDESKVKAVCDWMIAVIDHAEEHPASIEQDHAALKHLRSHLNSLDLPDVCEGCDAVATTSDSEGIPLCGDCWDALVEDTPSGLRLV